MAANLYASYLGPPSRMIRQIVLLAGIAGMLLGAGIGLYAGHQVHAAVAQLRVAASQGDTDAYNAAVPQLNAAVKLRSAGFGVVIAGALLIAAPTGYDAVRGRMAR